MAVVLNIGPHPDRWRRWTAEERPEPGTWYFEARPSTDGWQVHMNFRPLDGVMPPLWFKPFMWRPAPEIDWVETQIKQGPEGILALLNPQDYEDHVENSHALAQYKEQAKNKKKLLFGHPGGEKPHVIKTDKTLPGGEAMEHSIESVHMIGATHEGETAFVLDTSKVVVGHQDSTLASKFNSLSSIPKNVFDQVKEKEVLFQGKVGGQIFTVQLMDTDKSFEKQLQKFALHVYWAGATAVCLLELPYSSLTPASFLDVDKVVLVKAGHDSYKFVLTFFLAGFTKEVEMVVTKGDYSALKVTAPIPYLPYTLKNEIGPSLTFYDGSKSPHGKSLALGELPEPFGATYGFELKGNGKIAGIKMIADPALPAGEAFMMGEDGVVKMANITVDDLKTPTIKTEHLKATGYKGPLTGTMSYQIADGTGTVTISPQDALSDCPALIEGKHTYAKDHNTVVCEHCGFTPQVLSFWETKK